MDYIKIEQSGENIVVTGAGNFCLDDILQSGQCFRWEKLKDGAWHGIVSKYARTLRQDGTTLIFYGVSQDEFDQVWYRYFDFGRDYGMVKEKLSKDDVMRRAISYTPGMRVLNQEPWEALCSFILSQNNHIKRIRGLVLRLCENFGEKIDGGFAFPGPETLAKLTELDLAPVKSGFRAKYVLDAARKIASKEISLESIGGMTLQDADAHLQTISGVGPKVSACALLYGFGRAECVPRDVWINRVMERFYPDGIPAGIEDVAGLGQQYLFHTIRNSAEMLELSAKK
ncbi:MAG: DNA-3-methyladenine glycosylase 2 family protein [Oscillospiraceae bacterium]|nr:DNA-3-methyladenine glycosylase 2 family protein [Oscillospiraceae bacterium]